MRIINCVSHLNGFLLLDPSSSSSAFQLLDPIGAVPFLVVQGYWYTFLVTVVYGSHSDTSLHFFNCDSEDFFPSICTSCVQLLIYKSVHLSPVF